MRSTSGPERGTWAAYIKVARERAGLDKTELGRRIGGSDRGTITRWEDGKTRPRTADVVARVAEVLGLDLDEALAAAGMRPGAPVPVEPTVRDEERELILSSNASPRHKALMLERLEELRERDKQRRMEEIRFLLEQVS